MDAPIIAITCEKSGFSYTVASETRLDESEILVPPALRGDRPAALSWLLEEARRLIEDNGASQVRLWVASGKFAASAERIETEACVKIAAHQSTVAVVGLNKEKVRAAFGVPRGAGAYDTLLKRPEVAARSNKERRNQYLMATAPIE